MALVSSNNRYTHFTEILEPALRKPRLNSPPMWWPIRMSSQLLQPSLLNQLARPWAKRLAITTERVEANFKHFASTSFRNIENALLLSTAATYTHFLIMALKGFESLDIIYQFIILWVLVFLDFLVWAVVMSKERERTNKHDIFHLNTFTENYNKVTKLFGFLNFILI